MRILKNGEYANPLYGLEKEIITDEMIKALQDGKKLYCTVNDEYAVVIEMDTKRGGKCNGVIKNHYRN